MRAQVILLFILFACGRILFQESFNKTWEKRWEQSLYNKNTLSVSAANWNGEHDHLAGLTSDGFLSKTFLYSNVDSFSNQDKSLYIQFTLSTPENSACCDAFIKLFDSHLSPSDDRKSQYLLKFGPDLINNKLYIDLSYKGKIFNWTKTTKIPLNKIMNLYTLIITSDNRYKVYIDMVKAYEGILMEDWKMFVPKFIPNSRLKKPNIDNPASVPRFIPRHDEEMPKDWNKTLEGEWSATLMPNPEYYPIEVVEKYKEANVWSPGLVPNYKYSPSTDYGVMNTIQAVGIDLSVNKGQYIIGKIQISDLEAEANEFSFEWSRHVDRELYRIKEFKKTYPQLFTGEAAIDTKQEL